MPHSFSTRPPGDALTGHRDPHFRFMEYTQCAFTPGLGPGHAGTGLRPAGGPSGRQGRSGLLRPLAAGGRCIYQPDGPWLADDSSGRPCLGHARRRRYRCQCVGRFGDEGRRTACIHPAPDRGGRFAGVHFTEKFNRYSGNQNETQYQSGLKVAYNGNAAGWTPCGHRYHARG